MCMLALFVIVNVEYNLNLSQQKIKRYVLHVNTCEAYIYMCTYTCVHIHTCVVCIKNTNQAIFSSLGLWVLPYVLYAFVFNFFYSSCMFLINKNVAKSFH